MLLILAAGRQFGRSARTIRNSSDGSWCDFVGAVFGKAEYMKADRKGETQFQHQKTIDGAVLGCFGYVDGQGKMLVTHYLADVAGYRSVSLSAPDKMTRERLRLLRNGEDGPVEDLFPVDCTEKGDLGKLKEMAEKIKKDFESSNDDEEPQRKSPSYDKKEDPAKSTKTESAPKHSDGTNDSPKPKKGPSGAKASEKPSKKQNVRLINVRDPSTFGKPVQKLADFLTSPFRKPATKPDDKAGMTEPEKNQDSPAKPSLAARTSNDSKTDKDDLAEKGIEPSKIDKESASPQTKKGSEKPESKNKMNNDDEKASEKPEDKLDEVSNDPKQSPKSGKEP
uniref:Uncharacterized protein n=1 Tax=Anopheles culicifacies TaxID=139723 RepID=A0A182MV81_9DIPT